MQSYGDSGLGDLEAQLANKEREWKELQAARVHQLESSLKKAQEDCFSLRYHVHLTKTSGFSLKYSLKNPVSDLQKLHKNVVINQVSKSSDGHWQKFSPVPLGGTP